AVPVDGALRRDRRGERSGGLRGTRGRQRFPPRARIPMDARKYASMSDPFPMWRGGALHGARIAYETWGTLNAARDNALLLFTGLSPPAHAASSPADPSDGWWQGMVVPAYAAQFPGAARRLVCISGTAAAAPFAIALRSIQREAITHDPDWKGGNYSAERPPLTGQRLARKLGTVTYRSAAEWAQRFGREPIREDMRKRGDAFASEFAIQGYLEALAQRFVNVFDANCYLYISRAMDRFDLAAHGDPVTLLRRAALSAALVIGVQTDLLFSLGEQQAIARNLEAAGIITRFASLPCLEGHDAFL